MTSIIDKDFLKSILKISDNTPVKKSRLSYNQLITVIWLRLHPEFYLTWADLTYKVNEKFNTSFTSITYRKAFDRAVKNALFHNGKPFKVFDPALLELINHYRQDYNLQPLELEKGMEISETKSDECNNISLSTMTFNGNANARDLRLLQRQRAKEMAEYPSETDTKTQDTDLTGNHFDLAKFRAKK